MNNKAQDRLDIALEILNSEAFTYVMAGTCHHELHVHELQPLWREYQRLGGGWNNLRAEGYVESSEDDLAFAEDAVAMASFSDTEGQITADRLRFPI